MAFWRRQATAEEDEHYEAPVETRPPEGAAVGKESRRLGRLRKKAQKAAKKAARGAEKARKAARKVREASASSAEDAREDLRDRGVDGPSDLEGQDRAETLAKKDQRRLNRLRRKAQRRA